MIEIQIWEVSNKGVSHFDEFGHRHLETEGQVVMKSDHLKAMEAKDEEIEKYKSLANKNGRAVCEKRNIINEKAKEIAELEKEVDMLSQNINDQENEISYLEDQVMNLESQIW